MKTKTATCKAFTKSVNEKDRTVDQIVSVFGNVDLGGDRVNFGAFASSIERWEKSANTLPAYYSHQWDDPFANIGGVIEMEEIPAGDERLPNDEVVTPDGKTLRDLGGLRTKYQFDPEGENPKADQVFRLLAKRRIVQASFAYDIVKNRQGKGGVNELDELDLIEVGPTLLGMNPATTLLSAKAISAVAEEAGVTDEQAEAVLKAAEKDLNHTFIPGKEDATRCMLCEKGPRSVAHISRLSDDTDHGKKSDAHACPECGAILKDEDEDKQAEDGEQAGNGSSDGDQQGESESEEEAKRNEVRRALLEAELMELES